MKETDIHFYLSLASIKQTVSISKAQERSSSRVVEDRSSFSACPCGNILRDAALIHRSCTKRREFSVSCIPPLQRCRSNTLVKNYCTALWSDAVRVVRRDHYSMPSPLSEPDPLPPKEPTFRPLSCATISARIFSTFSGTVFS